MTANQMRELFKLLYNGATMIEMGYDDREVGMFLTTAQLQEINERLYANRNQVGEGFEGSSKRDTELDDLKSYAYIMSSNVNSFVYDLDGVLIDTLSKWQTGKYANSTLINLPKNYLYNVQERVDITYRNTTVVNLAVQPINEDYLLECLENPFAKPEGIKKVLRVVEARKDPASVQPDLSNRTSKRVTIIVGDNVTLTNYKLSYIRRPLDIIVDTLNPDNQVHCELDEVIHQAIVQRAVSLALASIGSQKYQIGVNERDNIK